MRTLVKIVLSLASVAILILLGALCWLYFYTRDLPDIIVLAQFAPTNTTPVYDPCIGNAIAIPYSAIGTNVHNAITATETNERDPGALRMTLNGLLSENLERSKTVVASWYISRTLCYQRSTNLRRQLSVIRTAIQLERQYSRQQLFNMYANRIFLGPSLIGVQKGSEFYFHKNPSDLTLAEAALLAGLIRSPSRFSPFTHPDRAIQRRNEVIDAMIAANMITAAEGESAKSNALGVSPAQPGT